VQTLLNSEQIYTKFPWKVTMSNVATAMVCC